MRSPARGAAPVSARSATLVILMLVWPAIATAQHIFGGYSALRLDGAITNGFTAAVSWPLGSRLDLAVEGNLERGLVNGENVDEWALLAGPQFVPWQATRLSSFVHLTAGIVRSRRQIEVLGVGIGRDGVCDGGCPYSTGPGVELGGGLDYRVTDRVALRLAQIDYRWARLDDTNAGRLRVSVGAVYRWGR